MQKGNFFMSNEDVFQYIASDEEERQVYINIISKINRTSQELCDVLCDSASASERYDELTKAFKNLEALVMLRKLYISGVIDSPRGGA